MKILQLSQGDPEWHALHKNRLTSSRFKTVLHGGPQAWHTLMKTLRPTKRAKNVTASSLEWGNEHEPAARLYYERATRQRVRSVGFILGDDPRIGVSPDGLVGRHGVIEIKCPFDSRIHARTCATREVPKAHLPQIQGILWVAKRSWCDFISFDPRLSTERLLILRVYRDERYIARLAERCQEFLELYENRRDPRKHKSIPKLF